MVMPKEMKDKMRAFTMGLSKQIQFINFNPAMSGEEKARAISELKGAPKEDMFEFLNNNFRRGPGLEGSLAHLVSLGRPRGAPSDSAKGIKGKLGL